MHPLFSPIDTADGQFRDGNPATGEPGTIVSAAWLNRLQQATRGTQSELIALLKAAGIEVDAQDQQQVLKALHTLSSQSVSAHEKAAYPHPQYALQTQVGSWRGVVGYTTSYQLQPDDTGKVISFYAMESAICTLPPTQGLSLGSSYKIISGAATRTTVKPFGTDILRTPFTEASAEILLQAEENVTITYMGGNHWSAHDGTNHGQPRAPAGTVIACASATAPKGYLKANGAAVSRAIYADLFACLGTHYGVGDGYSTFNLPDLRGEFVRGWDEGRGVDVGRAVGTPQSDELRSHSHSLAAPTSIYAAAGNTGLLIHSTSTPHWPVSPTGGTETRPRNIALLYCIKY